MSAILAKQAEIWTADLEKFKKQITIFCLNLILIYYAKTFTDPATRRMNLHTKISKICSTQASFRSPTRNGLRELSSRLSKMVFCIDYRELNSVKNENRTYYQEWTTEWTLFEKTEFSPVSTPAGDTSNFTYTIVTKLKLFFLPKSLSSLIKCHFV